LYLLLLYTNLICVILFSMKKRGRPKTAEPKNDYLDIRISILEKKAFRDAAQLAGIPVSTWVRERLRLAAIRELEGAGRRVPFIAPIPLGGPDEQP